MLERLNSKYFKLAVGKLKKETLDELVTCCPMCGDQKNRLHLYSSDVGDLVHCFNSGCELEAKHHSVRNFLDIIGSPYISSYKREQLGTTVEKLKTEQNVQGILDNLKKLPPEPKRTLEKEIPLHRLFGKAEDNEECHTYLLNRCIDVQPDWFFSTNKFFEYNGKRVFLENYILIPIYNEDYKYRGFYSRSIKEKTFSTFLLEDTEKIWRSNPDRFPDIICEGIFDALSTNFDNCAAMLGAGLSEEYRNTLPKSTLFAFDNDETGTRKSIEYCDKGFNIFVWPEVKYKDFNEMLTLGTSRTKIKKMIEDNTYSGIIAKTRLKMKEQ